MLIKIVDSITRNRQAIKELLVKAFLLILPAVAYFTFAYYLFTFDVFKNITQDYFTFDIAFYIYIGILYDILIAWAFVTSHIHSIIYNRPYNLWPRITLMLIALFSVMGLLFLLGIMSHDLSSSLRNNLTGVRDSEMDCTDSSRHFLVNSNVTCTIKQPILSNFTATITFFFKNDSSFVYTRNNSISFVSPYDIKRVGFEITGFDTSGKQISLSTARNFEFYTKDEYEQKNAQFVSYVVVMIAIVLYYIPGMVVNFKKILEREQH